MRRRIVTRRTVLLGAAAACAQLTAGLQLSRAAENARARAAIPPGAIDAARPARLADAAGAPGASGAGPARVLTASDVHVSDYPTVEALRWMSKEIERETGGKLAIRVYHSGQLGRENDTVDLVRFGALDITRINFASLNNPFPATQVMSLPYVFDSTEHMRRAVDGEPGRQVLQAFEKRGLIGLAIYDSGARCFYNHLRPVAQPHEMAGLKIRVPPSDIFVGLIRALGANPTPLSYGEIFSALQTKLIDGAENNWTTFYTSRHFEVAGFWSQSEHSYSPEALLMSKQQFESFSSREQEIIRTAATRSVPYMRTLWDKSEASSRAAVENSGIRVVEVDRAAFQKAAAPVLEAYLRDPELRSLYDSIRAVA